MEHSWSHPDPQQETQARGLGARTPHSDRVRAFCYRCDHIQLFKRYYPDHRWHLLLSILTAGLWLVSWASVIVIARVHPWRCQRCDWHLPRAVQRTVARASTQSSRMTAKDSSSKGTAT